MATENREISNIGVRSQYFSDQHSHNRIIRDLEKGLNGLRGVNDIAAGGQKTTPYLPRFPNEPDEYYLLRVQRTYLTNWFLRTISSDSGKILSNNVMISVGDKSNNELPEPFASWVKDMTLQQENMAMIAKSQLEISMKKGIVLAMVDYSEIEGRPFIREIDIDTVLAFRADKRTGKLNYLKFLTDVVTDSEEEDGQFLTNAVFELTPTAWTITDADDSDKVIDSGAIKRYKDGKKRIDDEIPVVVMYTNKTGTLLAESPYQTLAELTVEHFQVYSDIKNMMFYALTPLLAAKNVPLDFSIEMLASYLLVKMPATGDNDPDISWVQVDSAALDSGQKQLDAIERRISTFSIDSNAIRPGTLTATQMSMEGAGTNAALQSFATVLSAYITSMLEMMSTYDFKALNAGEIKAYVEPEFNSNDTDKEMRILLEMRRANALSARSVVEAAIQRKLLPPDFDKDKNEKELEEELDKMLEEEKAREGMKAKINASAQDSEGLLAGSGNEDVTDKPRDA